MQPNRSWYWCRWMLLVLVTCLGGCNGCRQTGDGLTKEELEKRAKERQKTMEVGAIQTLPDDSENEVLFAKPGHWHQTQQTFKSNREDLPSVVALGSLIRGTESPKLPGTNVINEYTRRTSLPKGQSKTVDLQYFVPFSGKKQDEFSTTTNRLFFRSELLSAPLMTPIMQAPSSQPANELKEHEYLMVVLSPQSSSYKYLGVLDAVFWRGEEFMIEERTRSYHLQLVNAKDNRYAFPTSMLNMTQIAVLVWDDVSPENLSATQKDAIVDWLHWGGQILISGPSSWSRLQESFLSPYLPASTAQATELTDEDFAQISNTWVVEDITLNAVKEPLKIVGPPVAGLDFSLSERGNWLPGAGKMVAESRIGRGRIVLTAYPMREPRIYQWKYYSSFLSTGLLRRHSRWFRRSKEDSSIAQYWRAPYDSSQRDPKMHSNVRILTRDLPLSASSEQSDSESVLPEMGMGGSAFTAIKGDSLNAPKSSDEAMQWGGRGAAWNDYSGLSSQALVALKEAAGIELPSRSTIIYILAGYLLCLVPLNWLVFKLLGRLEFAWIAAPLMAVAGVIVVTKVARLDIGFARRTTEIAVLELHEDYPRAHLTQYLALYTSLSTNYEIDFPDNDSVALPLGDISRNLRRAGSETRNLRTNFGRSEGVTLEPLTVYSNSTEMLHAEQIVGLDGGLRLGSLGANGDSGEALKNDTGLQLQECMLVRRSEDDQIELAWVGDLPSGQTAPLQFEPASSDRLWENWKNNPITQPDLPEVEVGSGSDNDALWIGGVLREIVRKTPIMQGQTRLFGFTNDRPSELRVNPAEDQYDGRCVIVAHLTPRILGNVTPDKNIMSVVKASMVKESETVKPEIDSDTQPILN